MDKLRDQRIHLIYVEILRFVQNDTSGISWFIPFLFSTNPNIFHALLRYLTQ